MEIEYNNKDNVLTYKVVGRDIEVQQWGRMIYVYDKQKLYNVIPLQKPYTYVEFKAFCEENFGHLENR